MIRLSLIVLTICGLFYAIYETNYLTILVILVAFIVFQTVSFIHYVEKSNRNLTSFLESIRYADFSRSFFVEGLGKSYDGLKTAFNDVIKDFQKIRAEKEEQYYFLQNVIQHIGICLVGFDRNGKVVLINNAAKKLFSTKNLENIDEVSGQLRRLPDIVKALRNGEKSVLKIHRDNDILQLVVYVTEFKLSEENIKLVSIQNIQQELEEKEMEAWQKLIRVLTHEIMNSITPIASLSTTINSMINEAKNEEGFIDLEIVDDIVQGLETINKRSNGLIHFVQTYRNLTKIPKPNFTVFPIIKMFDHIKSILGDELTKKNIGFDIQLKHDRLEMTADQELVEQILINLIKNSIHALEGRSGAQITLAGYMNEFGSIVVSVTDNGPGILPDVLDKIFIPFFTTKPTGSGIGLSLSRQIMRLHNGKISAYSVEEKETVFVLTF